MKLVTTLITLIALSAFALLAAGGLGFAAPAKSEAGSEKGGNAAPGLPLKWDARIPLAVQSAPVQWKGATFHLVTLGSIQFKLDKEAGTLSADVQGATTTFDEVTYDVSAAVFDASGNLLGTARTPCKVERLWLGKTIHSPLTLRLDFGTSLNYAKAASFMVSISEQKVLTPDDWAKK